MQNSPNGSMMNIKLKMDKSKPLKLIICSRKPMLVELELVIVSIVLR